MYDPSLEFIQAIETAGLRPPSSIIADGQIHRFSASGRPGDTNGWYVFHQDEFPAGAFGDWRKAISEKWSCTSDSVLTEEQRLNFEKRTEHIRHQRKLQRKAGYKAAAAEADKIWKGSAEASNDHPYLLSKQVDNYGLRVVQGKVVVPVWINGEMSSIQFIYADGKKKFFPGGRVKGGYFCIGQPKSVLFLCEGYATGATIHAVSGEAVAIAFNADNLKAVAEKLRSKFPTISLVICADDDFKTAGNPGLSKAKEAAQAVNARYIVPAFAKDRPSHATDFNDLALLEGKQVVKSQLAAVVSQSGDEWAAPRRIESTLLPVPSFDPEVLLPDGMRDWVVDEARRMNSPPDYIAAAALVALASIIGARCAIKPKSLDSWAIVPNLWGGIVGLPSAKKSPAISAALKPMEKLIQQANQDHQKSMDEYETQKLIHEAGIEAVEKGIKAAAKRREKAALSDLAIEHQLTREQAPGKPTVRRYKCNDTTVEKLGELLRENPAGLLVLRDELVGLIAAWDKEGREGERAFYLESWNGNSSFDTDRIGRGSVLIPNLCTSVFGGIQPDKLTGYLAQASHALANDGMLQRFQLLVYPDAHKWKWCDEHPNKEARSHVEAIFATLADIDPESYGAAPADDNCKFPYFRFSKEAQEVYIQWASELHTQRIPNEEHPLVEQHLGKYDKLFSSIALILHLVDCVSNNASGAITKDVTLRAAAWCEYLEAHARRCYGLLADRGVKAAQSLAKKLSDGKLEDNFTARDVKRKQWRYLTSDEAVKMALDWLEDDGWLRSQSFGGAGPGSGRRTRRYLINPKVKEADQREVA